MLKMFIRHPGEVKKLFFDAASTAVRHAKRGGDADPPSRVIARHFSVLLSVVYSSSYAFGLVYPASIQKLAFNTNSKCRAHSALLLEILREEGGCSSAAPSNREAF